MGDAIGEETLRKSRVSSAAERNLAWPLADRQADAQRQNERDLVRAAERERDERRQLELDQDHLHRLAIGGRVGYGLEREDLLWLFVVKQSKVLLFESGYRFPGFVVNHHVEPDEALRLGCGLCRKGLYNSLSGQHRER
jgi:hypothetical protein